MCQLFNKRSMAKGTYFGVNCIPLGRKVMVWILPAVSHHEVVS